MVGFSLQSIGAWQDSQTTDEAVHLLAGYSYWRTGDFRLNPEHPPLVKLLAAAPLLFTPPINFSTSQSWWTNANQWPWSRDFLYGGGQTLARARWLIWLGRLPMIAVWAGLGWLIFAWSKGRWGWTAGLTSLTFFIFDPNFLGHGHLITTDVALATGFFATIWAADRWLRRPSWPSLVWLCLLFGLTQLTKFSAVMLWAIVPGLAFIRWRRRPDLITPTWMLRACLGLFIGVTLLIWASYGLSLGVPDQSQVNLPRGLPDTASNLPVPAIQYWLGLSDVAQHNRLGHPEFSYLLGQWSIPDNQGWWYYFPLAMLIKMPIITLGLLMAAAGLGLVRLVSAWRGGQRRIPWSWWVLALPPLIYLAISLTSRINIGVRHVFPVYPWLFMAIGWLTAQIKFIRRPAVWLLPVAILMLTTVRAWPNMIGYFSGLVGGTAQGHRYLLDSNIDWNHDLWRLRDWLQARGQPPVQLAVFGSVPESKFFPGSSPIPTDVDIRTGKQADKLVVISVNQLWWHGAPFEWLRKLTPSERIGSSILVYDFR